MNNQNTYAIGSGLLTYDIIEHILKEDMKLTLSDDAKKKSIIAGNTSTGKKKIFQNRSMA